MLTPNKTKIEWCDYTLNPVKGLCPMACDYCYARAMYKRFKWNPEIRFEPIINLPSKPSRIFVGSTIELFGEWVDSFWLDSIFRSVKDNPQHIFQFLTKQPQNLIKFKFPDNCWVGVTATNREMFKSATHYLAEVEADVKYISLEPLLGQVLEYNKKPFMGGVSWVILGSQTKPYKPPKIEWVQEILVACHNADIPVFMKDNLRPLIDNSIGWGEGWKLRQEMPC